MPKSPPLALVLAVLFLALTSARAADDGEKPAMPMVAEITIAGPYPERSQQDVLNLGLGQTGGESFHNLV